MKLKNEKKKWWIAWWNWHESWPDDRHTMMMAVEELPAEHFPFPSGKILISLTLFTSSRTAAGFTPGPKAVAQRREFFDSNRILFFHPIYCELTHTRHDEREVSKRRYVSCLVAGWWLQVGKSKVLTCRKVESRDKHLQDAEVTCQPTHTSTWLN